MVVETFTGKVDTAVIDAVFIREFLCDQGVLCESIFHEPVLTLEKLAQQLFIPLDQIARSYLLQDSEGFAIVILPLGCGIDFKALQEQTGRQFEMAWPEDYAAVFPRMVSAFLPPLSELYAMPAYIDEGLTRYPELFIPDGSGQGLMKFQQDDFMRLQRTPVTLSIAVHQPGLPGGVGIQSKARQMREQISKLENLPPMPEVASKLLKLSCQPDTMPADVARVIEEDPAIVSQVMHYANSPWYGFRGKINNIEKAIFSVLGLDMVTNIALGMSTGNVFKLPENEYIDAEQLWKHSVHCAALSEALSRNLPRKHAVKPGTAYLAGLLHNIGFMILGHCFPAEFTLLARERARQPTRSTRDIEMDLFGMTHAEMGAELMRKWHLPDVIIQVMAHHHDVNYRGTSANEVLLVLLANRLLANKGIGDEIDTEIPADILATLGLELNSVLETLENIVDDSSALDAMAQQLAA